MDAAADASNPFSTRHVRPGRLAYRFAAAGDVREVASLVRRLEQQEWHGEIIGPHGAGKSTLLCALGTALEQAGHPVRLVSLGGGKPTPPTSELVGGADEERLLLLDGWEQLGWLARRALLAASRKPTKQKPASPIHGLVVTAHRPSGLPLLYEARPSLEIVQELVRELLENAGPARIVESDVEQAFTRCDGNLREVFFRLYDLHEQRRAP